MMCSVLLWALVLYSLILALWARRKLVRRQQLRDFSQERLCGVPPQTPHMFFGLVQIIRLIQALRRNSFLGYVEQLFEIHGNTFVYNTFGTQSVWTTDPENIQACLGTQSHEFEAGVARHQVIIPLVGHSILTTDGALWAHHRAMIRPNFVKSQLGNFDIFEKHFANLLACIPNDNSTVNLRDLFQRLTMDISTDFLLGCSTDSLVLHAIGQPDDFSDAWNEAMTWIPLRAHLGAIMKLMPHPSFFRACSIIHRFADHVVARALAPRHLAGKRYVFLHELAKEVKDRIQLRDHALSILTAGRDTTAELLSCAVNMLAKHPEVMRRLREEIADLEGSQPSFDSLKGMTYLRNVILEVLRLYPIGPVNARIATKDTTLPIGGGPNGDLPIMIEKGQQVLYCVWGMHRRKDLYGSDAASFRPERWETRKQGGWDFLPFNGGARQCIGQSFAMTEASYILVRFLQEFDDIEARELRPWQENLGLILSNFHDTLVGLKRHSGLNV